MIQEDWYAIKQIVNFFLGKYSFRSDSART